MKKSFSFDLAKEKFGKENQNHIKKDHRGNYTSNKCKAIVDSEYEAVTVEKYISSHPSNKPLVILRHDVDRKVKNALKMAEIENQFGINSTYYFRTIKKVFKAEFIKKIEKMDHEIGYHYEVLEKAKGDYGKAIELFKEELEEFRRIYEIKTICMHGNPLSKWTNRELWEKYNYEEFGIIGEAYISVDFNNVAYFTDTGRAWSNKCNLKDCVDVENPYLDGVKSTDDINKLICERIGDVYISIHPNRWNNGFG